MPYLAPCYFPVPHRHPEAEASALVAAFAPSCQNPLLTDLELLVLTHVSFGRRRIKEVTSRSGNLNDEDDNPVFDPKPDILERLKIWLAKAEETAESIREKIKEARHNSQLLNDARPGDGSAASQLNSLQTQSIGVHSVIPGPIPTSAGYPGQYYSGAPSFSSVYGQPGADAATGGFRSGSPPMAGVNSGPHIPGFSSSTASGPFLSFGPRHGAQLGSLT